METVFNLRSLLVFPFWLLMIFVPHWRWTYRSLQSPLVAAPAAILYVVLVLPNAGLTCRRDDYLVNGACAVLRSDAGVNRTAALTNRLGGAQLEAAARCGPGVSGTDGVYFLFLRLGSFLGQGA